MSLPRQNEATNSQVSTRIYFLALLGLLTAVGLAASYFVSDRLVGRALERHEAYSHAQRLADQIDGAAERMRHHHKEFLLRRDANYIGSYGSNASFILKAIAKIDTVLKDREVRHHVKNLEKLIPQHNAEFLHIARNRVRMGLTETIGIEGEFRSAAHALEKKLESLDSPKLTVILLTLRRHEKDFIARQHPKHITLVGSGVEHFMETLDVLGLQTDLKQEFVGLLDQYGTSFENWAARSIAIANSEAKLQSLFFDIDLNLTAIQNATEVLLEKAHADFSATRKQTRLISGSAAALVLVAGLILLWLIRSDIAARRKTEKELVIHRDFLQQKVNEATADMERQAVELAASLAKEKQLNELQRQFVSMASHEFRTPLAIIDQTAQRLKRNLDRDNLTPDALSDRIGRIRNAVSRMTRLMDSTLTAARLDEGKITIQIEPCNIAALIQQICDRHEEFFDSHKLVCTLDDLPETVYVDFGALDQIITNLLSNAAKYSPEADEVEVTGRTVGDQIEISIRDRGLGIDQDDLPNMFSRFFRAKTAMGIAGTGIGLHTVKTLAEMHDGTVHVESMKGEGSTFSVRLPIAGPASKKVERKQTAAA